MAYVYIIIIFLCFGHVAQETKWRKNMEKKNNDYYTIDLKHIFTEIWRRFWIVILAAIIVAGAAFVWSSYFIKPQYSASIKLYVNNVTSGSTIISSSQIAAAQQLVNTYREVLHSRPTYEAIIAKTGGSYTAGQMAGYISSGAINDTEIMYVKVTTSDPYEAAEIANCIAEILPDRISQVIEGSSVEIFETAIPNESKVSPNITQYTTTGMLLGALFAIAMIAIHTLLDNRIHDEDYVINNYKYPILAKIPSLADESHAKKHGRGYDAATQYGKK